MASVELLLPCDVGDYTDFYASIHHATNVGRMFRPDNPLLPNYSGDIQAWEYEPLGPFLAKNFATSISPWVVTMEALEPFRCAGDPRPDGDPQPLAYLDCTAAGAYAITLEVWLRSAKMAEPIRVSRSSFTSMFWTLAQMLAHHTSHGCPARPT